MNPSLNGIKPPDVQALPQICDRISFIYLEHCQINSQDGAVTVVDENGVVNIPAAMISVLMLGPGTSITHKAMLLIGNSGISTIWVGEEGVRYYAHGRALNTRTHLLQRQAELVSNTRAHLSVVRKMYQMRFPNEDVSSLTMQQLRGKEGSRIKNVYRMESDQWNVPWNKRLYRPDDFKAGDEINQALSAAHVCLYGLAHAVITALGCSAGLGFVHIGHECAFVYDIADLYKAKTSIPVAFETVSLCKADLEKEVRKKMRLVFVEQHILEQMVHDIQSLLLADNSISETEDTINEAIYLWDNSLGELPHGISYSYMESDRQ